MYTVRIPLLVAATTRIAEQKAWLEHGNIAYTLKWDGYYHILLAKGFLSEADAFDFVARARASIAWLLLNKGIAAEAELMPQEIHYHPDPEIAGESLAKSVEAKSLGPVDSIIDGSQTALYPSEKSIRVVTGFPPSVHTSIQSAQALATLVEGASFASSGRMAEDKKFGVALALYGAYFTEQSAKARFLTLIMALEALASATVKTQLALELLAKWGNEIHTLRSNPSLPPEDSASLEALHRELLFRRDDSVRSQIRKLIQTTLAPANDSEDRARDGVRLYDLRSTLVHQGTVDSRQLDQAISEAKSLVLRTLIARFERITAS